MADMRDPTGSDADTSPEFRRFVDSFFGHSFAAWHDGVDREALLALSGAERERAERLLLDGLAGDGDGRAAIGVGVLRLPAAIEPLRCRLDREGPGIVDVAEALWRITGERAAVEALLRSLVRGDATTRADAALALREVPDDDVREALWQATTDGDSFVRHHAAESLLRLAGYRSVIDRPDHPVIVLMHDDPSEQRQARQEITRLIHRG